MQMQIWSFVSLQKPTQKRDQRLLPIRKGFLLLIWYVFYLGLLRFKSWLGLWTASQPRQPQEWRRQAYLCQVSGLHTEHLKWLLKMRGNFFKTTVICMLCCWNSEDCTAPIPLNSFEPPFVMIVDRCTDHERAECIGVGGSGGCRPGDIERQDGIL